jgi:hypothetical protein
VTILTVNTGTPIPVGHEESQPDVDEDVLVRVRTVAAGRRTSVNPRVRDVLAEIAEREDRASKASAHLRAWSGRSTARMRIKTWSRDPPQEH